MPSHLVDKTKENTIVRSYIKRPISRLLPIQVHQIPSLVEDAVFGSTDRQHSASASLLQLIKQNTCRGEIISSLLSIPRQDSFSRRDAALEAVRHILANPIVTDDIVISDVLPLLLQQFRTGHDDEKTKALNLLSILIKRNARMRNIIVDAGISKELIIMLDRKNTNLTLQVERMVNDLVSTDDASSSAAIAMCEEGAIPQFLQLLRKGTELHFEAGKFLGLLATHSTTQHDLLDSNAISDFLVNLKEGNDRLKFKAGVLLRKIARHATGRQRQAVLDSGILPQLVSLLDDGSFPLRAESMWILSIFSEYSYFRDVIASAIPSVVRLLKDGEEEEKFEAFWTLEIFSKDKELRDAVFRAGALPDLVEFIKHGLYLGTAPPLTYLRNLDCEDASEKSILTRLIFTIRDGNHDDKQAAGKILLALARGASADHLRNAFAESAVITTLIAMLQLDSHSAKHNAALILRILCHEPLLRRCLLNEGGLDVLVNMLEHCEDDDKVSAAQVIGELARDIDLRIDIFQSGLIPVLLALLKNDDTSYNVRLVSVEVLCLFAEVDSFRDSLVKAGIIHILKPLASKATGLLREFSADLLRRCEGEGWLRRAMGRKLSLFL